MSDQRVKSAWGTWLSSALFACVLAACDDQPVEQETFVKAGELYLATTWHQDGKGVTNVQRIPADGSDWWYVDGYGCLLQAKDLERIKAAVARREGMGLTKESFESRAGVGCIPTWQGKHRPAYGDPK